MALKFFQSFNAIGSSTLKSLDDQLAFNRCRIVKGATLVLYRKNILEEVWKAIQTSQRLLIFIGGCDATDDAAIISRPKDITDQLLEGFEKLLEVRIHSQHRKSPLVFILLLPRHLITNPQIGSNLKQLNKKIKKLIINARAACPELNVTWVDTANLSSPEYFVKDEKHLSLKGSNKLICNLYTATQHLR